MTSNRALVDAYYQALAGLDVKAFGSLHHSDVVYNICEGKTDSEFPL
ncbi:MAG: hypothetical protein V7676_01145 [Parasphingorhabdus sp.]